MTSINRLRIVLLGLAILGVAVTLAAISHAQTPDYLYQLALAEAEQEQPVGGHPRPPACRECEYGYVNVLKDGKLVRAKCPACDGTGRQQETVTHPTTGTTPAATAPARKPAALVAPKVLKQAAQRVAAPTGYAMRGATSPAWTYPGNSRQSLINHLLADSIHRGKFTRARLETMTYAQLYALHSSDHNAQRGRSVGAITNPKSTSSCPNGNCPNQTMQSGFRLFRRR